MKDDQPRPASLFSRLGDPANAWTRIFLVITLFLFGFFLILLLVIRPAEAQERWMSSLRTHQTSNPDEAAGLRPFLAALKAVDWKELQRISPELRAVANFTEEPTTAHLQFLTRHREVSRQIALVAEGDELGFPDLTNRIEPINRPSLGDMESFSRLLAANAAVSLLSGNPVESMERSLDMITVGAMMCQPRERATLSLHVSGFFLMEAALPILELSMEVLREDLDTDPVLARLQRVNEIRQPMSEAILAEFRLAAETIQASSDRPERLADVLQFYNPDLHRPDALAEAFTQLHLAESIQNDMSLILPGLEEILFVAGDHREQVTREKLQGMVPNPLLSRQVPDTRALLSRERDLAGRLRGIEDFIQRRVGARQ